ncbi:hypothetical protein GCM10009805_24640 [Leucobacter chromiireducens subsp. solipictus]
MITHWRCVSVSPRSACADGTAMFMTVETTTIMSWVREIQLSAHQRAECAGGGVVGGAVSGMAILG